VNRLVAPSLACLGLLAAAVGCGTPDAPFTLTVHLENPTAYTYQGSGGALGLGVTFRVEGLEDGQDLVVDRACQGRVCGEPAAADPGRCGEESGKVDPGTSVPVTWSGRYFPRGVDPWGECLAPPRAVSPGDEVEVTVCGRLTGRNVGLASLHCTLPRRLDPGLVDSWSVVVPGAL
jgi:hypothetical protein